MQGIIYALLNYMNCSIKQDTNYEIVKCLLAHIHEIGSLSIEQTAALCHVSISTLNRFCSIIGYKNFSTLRQNLSYIEDKTYLLEDNQSSENEFIENMNDNMNTIAKIPSEVLDDIVSMIHQSSRIILTGFGDFQYPALYFQKELFNLGKLVEVVAQNKFYDSLQNLKEDDLIIVTSVHGHFLRLTSDSIIKLPCKKVLITEMKNQEILNLFDNYLRCGVHDDEPLRKYSIMRIYEKILQHYYRYIKELNK